MPSCPGTRAQWSVPPDRLDQAARDRHGGALVEHPGADRMRAPAGALEWFARGNRLRVFAGSGCDEIHSAGVDDRVRVRRTWTANGCRSLQVQRARRQKDAAILHIKLELQMLAHQ